MVTLHPSFHSLLRLLRVSQVLASECKDPARTRLLITHFSSAFLPLSQPQLAVDGLTSTRLKSSLTPLQGALLFHTLRSFRYGHCRLVLSAPALVEAIKDVQYNGPHHARPPYVVKVCLFTVTCRNWRAVIPDFVSNRLTSRPSVSPSSVGVLSPPISSDFGVILDLRTHSELLRAQMFDVF